MPSTPQQADDAIFAGALELASREERAAFLDRACAVDQSQRRRVEALLRSHDEAGDFLKEPLVATSPSIAEASITEGPGTLIGRYKLLQQIGEGGFGNVYMAQQKEPVRRKVALKIIKLGMDSKEIIARFEAERQALALMDHPNIARVLDAGATQTGRPYFVMELVNGVAIGEFCDKNRLSTRPRLELFIAVCQAVQHAHQKGVIHRDLKPSNILVTLHDGKPVPKVIDFGVAKAINQELTEKTLFTAFGHMVGTPQYMSPEQAELSGLDVDTRSDIYSLGVVLYELLTGTTPLEAKQLRHAAYAELQRLIREEEAPRPSQRVSALGEWLSVVAQDRKCDPVQLQRLLRGELDWIVMKALDKDRTRRYETANSLARDLQHYLADEPVEACPPTVGYRLHKFARKNRSLLMTAASFAAVLLLGATVSIWQAVLATQAETRANDNAQQAAAQKLEAQEQAEKVKELNAKLRATLYAAQMNLAQNALDARGIERVEELLELQRPKLGETDLRNFEWHYLYRVSHAEFHLRGHTSNVNCVAYSRDGKRLASGGADDVIVWDAQTGKLLLRFTAVDKGAVSSVAYSPDGKHLATACNFWDAAKKSICGEAKVWDAESGKEIHFLQGHAGGINSVAFCPGGNRLATGSVDKTVKVWDAQAGKEIMSLKGHTQEVVNVAFSPDGKRLASSSGQGAGSGETILWNAESGDKLYTLNAGNLSVAFSPDSKRLASNSMSKVTVWNVQTGKELFTTKKISGGVLCVAFSPDGKRLATGASDMRSSEGHPNQGGDVKIWDAESGQELVTLLAHPGSWGVKVAFSPDGKHLASAGNKSVKVWDTQARPNPRILKTVKADDPFLPPYAFVRGVSFSPDGKRLATSTENKSFGKGPQSQGGDVKIWDALTGQELFTLPVFDAKVVFSPDGKRLATTAKGAVNLWDAKTGKELFSMKGNAAIAFSSDGKYLASGGSTGPGGGMAIVMWDTHTGELLPTFEGYKNGPLLNVAFSPDGALLASTGLVFEGKGPESKLKVWETRTGKELFTHRLATALARGVAFSKDGKRLASHTYDAVQVWDTRTGENQLTFKGHTVGFNSVAFSPDGKRLVTSASDKTVKLWDAQSGKELLTLEGHGGKLNEVAFSPDGNWLAAGSAHGTVKIWDATPLPETPE
jgi:WD40 repeat protein/serine/threonine protein kinase